MRAKPSAGRLSGRTARFGLVLVLVLGVSAGVPPTSLGTGDTTPPEFFAIEAVDGPVVLDHVVLIFLEAIDPTSIPDATDFGVRVSPPGPFPSPEPTPPPYRPATGLSFIYEGLNNAPDLFADGVSLLRLDLGTTVSTDDLVSIRYTPGTHPLRDLAGNGAVAVTMDVSYVSGLNGGGAIVDDGLGPNHVLLIWPWAFDPVLPPITDFTVTVNGFPQTPVARTLQLPGYGWGFLDLTLATPVSLGDTVTLTYVESTPVLTRLGGAPIGPIIDAPVYLSIPATPTRSTPTGTAVAVAPPDSSTGTSPLSITFASVATSGTTTLASSSTGPAAPAGFSFGDPPVYYDLATTATFSSAEVCFNYSPTSFTPPESSLRLMHYASGAWVDTTLPGYPDTVAHRVCGTVTSFSPFAIAGPPPIAFSGFFAPVDNKPVVNEVKAGSAVPVKFGLGGDFGLSIFAPGSPSSQATPCVGGSPIDPVEETVLPGSATLSYTAGNGLYIYVWKTNKLWTGCRTLKLTFVDGTVKTASFRFR